MSAGMGNIGHHHFRRSARLEVSDAIGEAHDAVRIANVDVLRIRSQRIEGDAERLVQAVHKYLRGLRRARLADAAHDQDFAGPATGDEEVAIRRGADHPRIAEASCQAVDLKARQSVQHRARRLRHVLRIISHRGRRVGFGYIRSGNQTADAWVVTGPIAKRGLSVEDGLLCAGAREECRSETCRDDQKQKNTNTRESIHGFLRLPKDATATILLQIDSGFQP